MSNDHVQQKTRSTEKTTKISQDDNPKDLDMREKDKTDPNGSMRADEIIESNNFLGDLS